MQRIVKNRLKIKLCSRKENNMSSLLIFVGILLIIGGLLGKKEERRRDRFEDYVWTQFDQHNWNKEIKRKKKK